MGVELGARSVGVGAGGILGLLGINRGCGLIICSARPSHGDCTMEEAGYKRSCQRRAAQQRVQHATTKSRVHAIATLGLPAGMSGHRPWMKLTCAIAAEIAEIAALPPPLRPPTSSRRSRDAEEALRAI